MFHSLFSPEGKKMNLLKESKSKALVLLQKLLLAYLNTVMLITTSNKYTILKLYSDTIQCNGKAGKALLCVTELFSFQFGCTSVFGKL